MGCREDRGGSFGGSGVGIGAGAGLAAGVGVGALGAGAALEGGFDGSDFAAFVFAGGFFYAGVGTVAGAVIAAIVKIFEGDLFGGHHWVDPLDYLAIHAPELAATGAGDYVVGSNSAIIKVVKLYGNWCGPGWSGRKPLPHNQPIPKNDPTLKDSIDSLDRCCEVHDYCFSDCQARFPNDLFERRVCYKKCDIALGTCTDRLHSAGTFPVNPMSWIIQQYGYDAGNSPVFK